MNIFGESYYSNKLTKNICRQVISVVNSYAKTFRKTGFPTFSICLELLSVLLPKSHHMLYHFVLDKERQLPYLGPQQLQFSFIPHTPKNDSCVLGNARFHLHSTAWKRDIVVTMVKGLGLEKTKKVVRYVKSTGTLVYYAVFMVFFGYCYAFFVDKCIIKANLIHL